MFRTIFSWIVITFLALSFFNTRTHAEEEIYSVAILSFETRGAGMEGLGEDVRDLLFAGLVENEKILLVERNELDQILEEAKLNLSGNVNSQQVTQIGQLTGAKILITGSVFKVSNKIYIVAKIIGTETGKVLGKSVNGTEKIDVLTNVLIKKVDEAIISTASTLMPAAIDEGSLLARISSQLKGRTLPPVYVNISEKHIGKSMEDPSAETEIMHIYKKLGGTVIDKEEGDISNVKYKILGQGFSEFATRTRDLISVKARLEIKVLDQNGEVIAIDSQTTVKVDLNEILAGKAALQEAARLIAERIIPTLGEEK